MRNISTHFCGPCYDKYAESRMYDSEWVNYYWCSTGETSPSVGRTRCGCCGIEQFSRMEGRGGHVRPAPGSHPRPDRLTRHGGPRTRR